MSFRETFGGTSKQDDDHWISVSDLMAGLMVIFLFIAITYIRPVLNDRNEWLDMAKAFQQAELDIYESLYKEFKEDLPRWGAELDREDLTIRFFEPQVLFDSQQITIKPRFKEILADFFPRYLKVLIGYKKHIEEVRIEGHTSSIWLNAADEDDAYFRNMKLSQGRTRAVLEYCLRLSAITDFKKWAIALLTANGLSSSKPVIVNGKENLDRSRRVEFRVRTNAKKEMLEILNRQK